MIDETQFVTPIHRIYVQMTGRECDLTLNRVFEWRNFMARGWGLDEVKTVIVHLKAKIRQGQKWESCLAFRNFINHDNFEEALSEARALSRKPAPDAARSVLRATGRPETRTPISQTRHVSEVMTEAGHQAFKEFQELKKKL